MSLILPMIPESLIKGYTKEWSWNSSDPIFTIYIRGCYPNKSGDIKFNSNSSCIYSIFPNRQTRYDFTQFTNMLKNTSNEIKSATTHSEAVSIYQKLLTNMNDSPIGMFIDINEPMPFIEGTKLKKENMDILRKLNNEFTNMFKILIELVESKKASKEKKIAKNTVEAKPVEAKPVEAKPVEVKPTEVKPTEAKPVEAKSKEEDEINLNTADFDPSSWRNQLAKAEERPNELAEEIKQLEKDLEENHDWAIKGRLNKRKKELEKMPDIIETLKANIAAKQVYYSDGHQATYKTWLLTLPSNIVDTVRSGLMPAATYLSAEDEKMIVHLARNPAQRLAISQQLAEAQKAANRLRKNKDAIVYTLTDLQQRFQAIMNKVKASEYYVKLITINE
jgi:cell division septation protein DedD